MGGYPAELADVTLRFDLHLAAREAEMSGTHCPKCNKDIGLWAVVKAAGRAGLGALIAKRD
jgi:hypothetical protein